MTHWLLIGKLALTLLLTAYKCCSVALLTVVSYNELFPLNNVFSMQLYEIFTVLVKTYIKFLFRWKFSTYITGSFSIKGGLYHYLTYLFIFTFLVLVTGFLNSSLWLHLQKVYCPMPSSIWVAVGGMFWEQMMEWKSLVSRTVLPAWNLSCMWECAATSLMA